MPPKNTHYAVANGRQRGIYRTWEECQRQVHQFPAATFKGFTSMSEAQQYMKSKGVNPAEIKEQKAIPDKSVKQIQKPKYQQNHSASPALQTKTFSFDSTTDRTLLDQDPCIQASPDRTYKLMFDGGSRGNPGPAGSGAFLSDDSTGKEIGSISRFVGSQTNNFAEYTALILGLAAALRIGVKKIKASGDSKLVVNQVCGRWQVKNENIYPLHKQAVALKNMFSSFALEHIYRAGNSKADALANTAMDGSGWEGLKTPQGMVHFSVKQAAEKIQKQPLIKESLPNLKRERDETPEQSVLKTGLGTRRNCGSRSSFQDYVKLMDQIKWGSRPSRVQRSRVGFGDRTSVFYKNCMLGSSSKQSMAFSSAISSDFKARNLQLTSSHISWRSHGKKGQLEGVGISAQCFCSSLKVGRRPLFLQAQHLHLFSRGLNLVRCI